MSPPDGQDGRNERDGRDAAGSGSDGAHVLVDRRRWFDVRILLTIVLGCYGVVLTVLGAIASPQDLRTADGVRINLWTGLGLLAVAALFLLWSWLRPLRSTPAAPTGRTTGGGDGRRE